jgi:hypothetical protein
MHALPHTLRDIARPAGTCLRVTITGRAGGEWLAVREADRWALGMDPARPADASVTLDQDTAWRVVTKGLTPAGAQGLATIEGDPELGERVLEMVAIIA